MNIITHLFRIHILLYMHLVSLTRLSVTRLGLSPTSVVSFRLTTFCWMSCSFSRWMRITCLSDHLDITIALFRSSYICEVQKGTTFSDLNYEFSVFLLNAISSRLVRNGGNRKAVRLLELIGPSWLRLGASFGASCVGVLQISRARLGRHGIVLEGLEGVPGYLGCLECVWKHFASENHAQA